MFKPTAEYVVIEPMKVSTELVMPENLETKDSGQLFEVILVGKGFYTEQGQLIEWEVKPGDIAAIMGKIVRIPSLDGSVLVARAIDVIGIDRL